MPETMNAVGKVAVNCLGITERTDFCIYPDGLPTQIVAFEPGKPTLMEKPYADYLVSLDSGRYSIQDAAPAPEVQAPTVEPQAPAGKKPKRKYTRRKQ